MKKKILNSWDLENKFYFNTSSSRLKKIITHYEIFKKSLNVKGSIIECGVFRGNSLNRLLLFRDMLIGLPTKKVFGFDVFGKFPKQLNKKDNRFAKKHNKIAGSGIDEKILNQNLKKKGFKNFQLIKGNVEKTLNNFLNKNKKLKISFLHLDLDVYAPTYYALDKLYKKVSYGGIVLLDDYGKIHGATKATKDFFKNNRIKYKISSTIFDRKLKFIVKGIY